MKTKSSKIVTLSAAMLALMPVHDAYAQCVSSLIAYTVVVQPLNFATLIPCTASSGQVIVDQKNGNRTTAGCISGVSGTVSLATLRIQANQDKNNEKVLASAPAMVTINNGNGNTMTLTAVSFDKGNGFQTVTLRGMQTDTYDIGGVLRVDAGQPKGTYTGNFTINIVCK